ncbi:MAG: AAA family ATPase [Bacteriovoracaceae bacterium]
MILNRLKIENIASLKGKHELNFKTSLQNENLFAITGPTGSGKSSLLAAISLALYGKHYKEKLSAIELVTLGTSSGRSTLFFSYNGTEYKALWEGKLRKANGELLKKPDWGRELYILQDGDWKLTPKKTEEIIKLTFDQFCKTIILNQGEFQRFLTSDFKERKEILEKLTEDHQLVAMGELLNKDIRELDHKIDLKLSEIKGIESLPLEDLKDLRENFKSKSEKEKFYKIEFIRVDSNYRFFQSLITSIKERLTNIERKKTLSQTLLEKQKSYNDFKGQLEEIQTDFQKKEQKLRQSEPELIKADSAQKKILYMKEQVAIHLKSHKSKSERHLDLVEKEQKYQTELKDLHQKKKEFQLVPESDYLSGLALEKLENLIKNYNEGQNLERLALSEIVYTEKELTNLKNEWTEINSNVLDINNRLISLSEAQKSLLAPWQTENEKVPEKLQLMQKELLKMKQSQSDLLKKNQEKALFEKKLTDVHKEANILVMDLYEQEKKFSITEQKLKIYELATHINACQETSLKDGHCVVCGNNFDKLPANPYLEKAIQDDLLDEKNKQEELQIKIDILKQDKNRLNLTLTHTDEQIRKLKKDELEELSKWKLNNLVDLAPKVLEQEKKVKDFEEIHRKNQEYKEEISLKKEQKIDLEKKFNQISEKTNETQIKEKSLKEKMKERRLTLLQQLKEMEELFPKSLSTNEKLNNVEIYLRECRELEKLLREARHVDMNLQSLTNEKLDLQMELKEIKETLEHREIEIKNEVEAVNAITGGNDPGKMLKDLKDAASEAQNQLKLWMGREKDQLSDLKDYEGRLKMAQEQIEDYTVQVKKNALAFILDSEKIRSDGFHYFQEEPLYALFIQMVGGKFDQNLPVDDYDLGSLELFAEEATRAHISMKEKVIQLEQELIVTKTQLELFDKNEKRSNELTLEIEEIKQLLTRKKNLYLVMGKDEFRTFLLSMVERQLLILANNELKSLCGERYELVQSSRKNTMAPEFSVLDRWSGGLKRNIFTLSGGETFMMSLALALGLAEMTRGQAEINCFFIDEGFGTLDHESIEEVLQVLLNMRAQGKQIGIISHIRSLTDRIPVNIRLSKSSTGNSRLDYFYN